MSDREWESEWNPCIEIKLNETSKRCEGVEVDTMNVKDKQKNTIFIQKENQSHNRNNKIAAAKKHHKSHFGRVKSESEIRLDHRQEIEHQSQWTKRKLCVCV